MNIIFMGSPEFAVPCLEKLYDLYNVVGVITQPDKPKGRGQKMQPNPVKETALKYEIPVYQPDRLRKDLNLINNLKNMDIDLIVVVAYGQILPAEVLSIPKHGCINVHASLLPDLRGAAPINWAIIRGLKKTGITTMLMNEGLDTGDMLMKEEVAIGDDETAEELHDKLMIMGSELLIKTIKALESNNLYPEKQDDSKSTYAQMLNKNMGNIDWALSNVEIFNLIRGITPWPGAFTFLNKKIIKVLKAGKGNSTKTSDHGCVIGINKDGIEISCGIGSIIVTELQEIGGKRMSVSSYLNGHNISIGDRFDMEAN
jgi:methionyl-tRNA formyltransferase